ncbi:MAG: tetratricopeptide repeat protein [Crocinitomicaceae bacterium]
MAKNKNSKKEELEQLTTTESFFDKNKKILIGGGVIVLLIIISLVGYKQFIHKPKVEASHNAYWEAFFAYQNNDTTNVALVGNENFVGLEDVAAEYDGTPGGEIANYATATEYMERGQFNEALSYLDDTDFDDVMLGTLVIGLKGDCYVELGELDNAVEKFEEAANREPNEYTSPIFLKKAGLVYEKLDNKEAAVKAYQRIKDEWETSSEATDIDKYIVRAQN